MVFHIFGDLMPGFNPRTFMQTNLPPADAATLAKARDKLKAIAAQQGLAIHLEPPPLSTTPNPIAVPTCLAIGTEPSPTHFYAVTEQTLLAREGKTEFTPAEQYPLLQPSMRCFLYSTAEQALIQLRNKAKPAGFWRTTRPFLFMVTTNTSLWDVVPVLYKALFNA